MQGGSVLQICRAEPLVWDAIIPLSALYERPLIHETSPWLLINYAAAVRHQHHREAVIWYTRSLALLQQHINQGTADLMVALVSCILFIVIELLTGAAKVLSSCTNGVPDWFLVPRQQQPRLSPPWSPSSVVWERVFIETEATLCLAPTALAWTRNPEGKQPPFMFEMGVFLPPFITGLKCPFLELRCQAFRYMAQAPPVQRMFMCTPAAHMVAIRIGLEENPSNLPGTASEVYELLAQPGHIPLAQYRICNFSVSSVIDEEVKPS
ncbi:Protein of unknown function DUF3468 [Penicillium mononematosum]|uniref:Protein of unknown function DUF3468 n=1 Tax=Penicillium mononematosum TaxID=268346 RepID=UPI002547C8E0|nr:Protein of unknown function DUF3468 [Penicillium mononematosum]KAJ6178486.1 Protein of unknown function DUF3468 [Penicillium mononematosum]